MSTRKSGWLQAVAIVAIVLGGLGILISSYSFVKLTMQLAMSNQISMPSSGGFKLPPEQLKIQEDILTKTLQISKRWYPVLAPLYIAELLIALCLIIGGVGVLRLRPKGRTLLRLAFCAAIILEIAQLIPAVIVQHEISCVVSTDMPQMMKASTPPNGPQMPADMDQTMGTMIHGVYMVMIAVTVLMKLCETSFYLFGALYLGRTHVRDCFAEPVDAVLAEPIEPHFEGM